MSIIGGYMPGTKSYKIHPIKNIVIKKNGWETIKLIVDNKDMDFINIGGDIHFYIKSNHDDCTMDLYVEDHYNNLLIYSSKNLFHYTITFIEPIKKNKIEQIVKYEDDKIYDF